MVGKECLSDIKYEVDKIIGDSRSQRTNIWLKGDYGRLYITGGSKTRKYQAWVDVNGKVECWDAYWRAFGITEEKLKKLYVEKCTVKK